MDWTKDDGIFMPMLNDTWFGNVSKTILKRCRKEQHDIVLTYDPAIRDWGVKF
jgi:hypothetical protein